MNVRILIFVIILIILLLSGFYLYLENTSLQVTSYNISNDKISEDFDNYKIIQVSDYHNTTSKKLTIQVVEEIKNQNPNFIVLTGDLIDSRRTNVDASINFIKQIIDIAPIYYVTGNHESRVMEYTELKEKMNELGVHILENKLETIKQNASFINLIGINDPSFAHESEIEDDEIIRTQLNNLKYDKDNYTILLSHRPEVFNTYVSENIDLILTGHAHGGQIRLPLIGGIIAPNQGLFPKYASGKYEEKDTTMIVSRGIGNSLFPFRINNRPELIIVELNKN